VLFKIKIKMNTKSFTLIFRMSDSEKKHSTLYVFSDRHIV